MAALLHLLQANRFVVLGATLALMLAAVCLVILTLSEAGVRILPRAAIWRPTGPSLPPC